MHNISCDFMDTHGDTYLEFVSAQDTIRLDAIKLKFPDADLDWDRNWVLTKVTIKAGVFSGQFAGEFMTTDFELLKRQLVLLDTDFNNGAKFSPLERQLILTITGDGLGQFEMECEVTPEPNSRQKLTFSMSFDQTEIKSYVRQLDRITKQFPVDGDFKIDDQQGSI